MSRLISRILLTILLFPLASLLYLVAYLFAYEALEFRSDETAANILAGIVAWAFMGIYWYLMWYRDVRWTNERVLRTVLAAGAAVAAGIVIGGLVGMLEEDVGAFVGSAAAPLLWLGATAFIWREARGEVVSRGADGGTVVCPACDYNLAGLREARCPECGVQFTLDELFARQPGRESEELTSRAKPAKTRPAESPA